MQARAKTITVEAMVNKAELSAVAAKKIRENVFSKIREIGLNCRS